MVTRTVEIKIDKGDIGQATASIGRLKKAIEQLNLEISHMNTAISSIAANSAKAEKALVDAANRVYDSRARTRRQTTSTPNPRAKESVNIEGHVETTTGAAIAADVEKQVDKKIEAGQKTLQNMEKLQSALKKKGKEKEQVDQKIEVKAKELDLDIQIFDKPNVVYSPKADKIPSGHLPSSRTTPPRRGVSEDVYSGTGKDWINREEFTAVLPKRQIDINDAINELDPKILAKARGPVNVKSFSTYMSEPGTMYIPRGKIDPIKTKHEFVHAQSIDKEFATNYSKMFGGNTKKALEEFNKNFVARGTRVSDVFKLATERYGMRPTASEDILKEFGAILGQTFSGDRKKWATDFRNVIKKMVPTGAKMPSDKQLAPMFDMFTQSTGLAKAMEWLEYPKKSFKDKDDFNLWKEHVKRLGKRIKTQDPGSVEVFKQTSKKALSKFVSYNEPLLQKGEIHEGGYRIARLAIDLNGQFDEMGREYKTILATHNKQIVGALAYVYDKRINALSVDLLGVTTPGHGIGSKLLKNLRNRAKAYGAKSLYVGAASPTAQKFYMREGFDFTDPHFAKQHIPVDWNMEMVKHLTSDPLYFLESDKPTDLPDEGEPVISDDLIGDEQKKKKKTPKKKKTKPAATPLSLGEGNPISDELSQQEYPTDIFKYRLPPIIGSGQNVASFEALLQKALGKETFTVSHRMKHRDKEYGPHANMWVTTRIDPTKSSQTVAHINKNIDAIIGEGGLAPGLVTQMGRLKEQDHGNLYRTAPPDRNKIAADAKKKKDKEDERNEKLRIQEEQRIANSTFRTKKALYSHKQREQREMAKLQKQFGSVTWDVGDVINEKFGEKPGSIFEISPQGRMVPGAEKPQRTSAWGRMKKEIIETNNIGKIIDGLVQKGGALGRLSWTFTSLAMSSLGVYFSLIGIVTMVQRGIGMIFGPLSNLQSLITSIAQSKAFTPELGLEGFLGDMLGDDPMGKMVEGWKKMTGLASTFTGMFGAFGAKVLTDEETWGHIVNIVKQIQEVLSDQTFFELIKGIFREIDKNMPVILNAFVTLATLIKDVILPHAALFAKAWSFSLIMMPIASLLSALANIGKSLLMLTGLVWNLNRAFLAAFSADSLASYGRMLSRMGILSGQAGTTAGLLFATGFGAALGLIGIEIIKQLDVFNGVGGKTNIFGVAREKGYAAGHGGSLEGFQPNQKAAWWDFMGITGRAAGGPLRKGQAAVVGERGPELIIPQGDVDVLPNSKLRMLAEGTNPTNLFPSASSNWYVPSATEAIKKNTDAITDLTKEIRTGQLVSAQGALYHAGKNGGPTAEDMTKTRGFFMSNGGVIPATTGVGNQWVTKTGTNTLTPPDEITPKKSILESIGGTIGIGLTTALGANIITGGAIKSGFGRAIGGIQGIPGRVGGMFSRTPSFGGPTPPETALMTPAGQGMAPAARPLPGSAIANEMGLFAGITRAIEVAVTGPKSPMEAFGRFFSMGKGSPEDKAKGAMWDPFIKASYDKSHSVGSIDKETTETLKKASKNQLDEQKDTNRYLSAITNNTRNSADFAAKVRANVAAGGSGVGGFGGGGPSGSGGRSTQTINVPSGGGGTPPGGRGDNTAPTLPPSFTNVGNYWGPGGEGWNAGPGNTPPYTPGGSMIPPGSNIPSVGAPSVGYGLQSYGPNGPTGGTNYIDPYAGQYNQNGKFNADGTVYTDATGTSFDTSKTPFQIPAGAVEPGSGGTGGGRTSGTNWSISNTNPVTGKPYTSTKTSMGGDWSSSSSQTKVEKVPDPNTIMLNIGGTSIQTDKRTVDFVSMERQMKEAAESQQQAAQYSSLSSAPVGSLQYAMEANTAYNTSTAGIADQQKLAEMGTGAHQAAVTATSGSYAASLPEGVTPPAGYTMGGLVNIAGFTARTWTSGGSTIVYNRSTKQFENYTGTGSMAPKSLQIGGFLKSDQLIKAHAGEVVAPFEKIAGMIGNGNSSGGTSNNTSTTNDISVTINISGNADKDVTDDMIRKLKKELFGRGVF
jgi:hypothetical protein